MSQVLTPRQRACIGALAGGATINEAATVAGVTRRTVLRWRSLPLFTAELQAADVEAMSELARYLNAGAREAADVLRTVMNDVKVPAGVRVRAAAEYLAHRERFYELLTLTERLAAVEARGVA